MLFHDYSRRPIFLHFHLSSQLAACKCSIETGHKPGSAGDGSDCSVNNLPRQTIKIYLLCYGSKLTLTSALTHFKKAFFYFIECS